MKKNTFFENKGRIVIEGLAKMFSLDLSYFIKKGLWVFIRYIAIGITGLLVSVGFTRLGTKELFGQYQFVLNFLAILSVISLPGLNTVALRSVARGKDGIVRKVIRTSFVYSLLAVPIIVGYGVYQIIHENLIMGTTLIMAGCLFPFFYAPNTWYVFFEGKTLFRDASLRIILSNIILAVSMFGALYFKANLFFVVLTFLFVNAVMNWVYYYEISKKSTEFSDKIDMKYGLNCTIQKFTYSFSDSVPVLVISFIFGFQHLAIYQIAYFLIALVIGFISALSATYVPLLFKYKKINYFKIVWQNLAMGIIFFVGFVIFIRIFFFVFYSRSYQESYDLAMMISFIIILIPLRLFLVNYLTSISKNKIVILSNIFANLASLGVLFIIKGTGFQFSALVYVYSLNALLIIPLLFNYFLIASRKIDSILSEIS
jgi:O-antigen/teichoic acid export membrane protein